MENKEQNQNLNNPNSVLQGDALQNQTGNIFKNKFFIGFVVLSALVAFLIGGFVLGNKNLGQKACTLEAKICPDGTSVGRTGPNCEFTKCPSSNKKEEVIYCQETKTCPNGYICDRCLGNNPENGPTTDPEKMCVCIKNSSVTPTQADLNSIQQNILEVPQLGVKFSLSEDIKDAYVVVPKSQPNDYVYLKVHSLDSESQCASDESSTAAISKVGRDEINPMSDKKYSDSSNGVTIGNYYYYIDLAQYSCAESTSGKAKLELVRKAFSNAFSTIQKL